MEANGETGENPKRRAGHLVVVVVSVLSQLRRDVRRSEEGGRKGRGFWWETRKNKKITSC